MEKDFEMTKEQYDNLIKAMQPVHMIMLQCGTPPSQQENANNAWKALGDEMGFDGMTVKPNGKGSLCEDPESPLNKWRGTHLSDPNFRMWYAGQIADIANRVQQE